MMRKEWYSMKVWVAVSCGVWKESEAAIGSLNCWSLHFVSATTDSNASSHRETR